MLIKVVDVTLPERGYLSSRIAGPVNNRVLLDVRGHSGMSSWPCVLFTAPEAAVDIANDTITLRPGPYRLQEAQDKRGQRLLRFYEANEANAKDALLAFSVDGHLVPEASDQGVVELARAEGYSRTGRHGDRWALIAAPPGAIIAVEPYEPHGENDPDYYRVQPNGLEALGNTDAVLSPDEW